MSLPEKVVNTKVEALGALESAMQYLVESRGLTSGADLYADQDSLAARKALSKSASDIRSEI